MKKFFWIPFCILLLITASALLNAKFSTVCVDDWCASIKQSQSAAKNDRWQAARLALSAAHDGWSDHVTYFHIVLQHDELNDAEELFAQAESFLTQRDLAEFCACTAALCAQLQVLGEMQQISIKNIL